MPWTTDPDADWAGRPWLPLPPDAAERSVAAQTGDPASMLEHYKRLLLVRRAVPALHRGDLELLDAPEGVVRWRRDAVPRPGEDPLAPTVVEVAVNFTSQPVAEAISDGRPLGGTLLPGDSGDPGALGPDEARIVAIA
jgi:glycosidase